MHFLEFQIENLKLCKVVCMGIKKSDDTLVRAVSLRFMSAMIFIVREDYSIPFYNYVIADQLHLRNTSLTLLF